MESIPRGHYKDEVIDLKGPCQEDLNLEYKKLKAICT